MESTDLDMGEIFDDRDDNEDIGALQDMEENTQDASQEDNEDESGKYTRSSCIKTKLIDAWLILKDLDTQWSEYKQIFRVPLIWYQVCLH